MDRCFRYIVFSVQSYSVSGLSHSNLSPTTTVSQLIIYRVTKCLQKSSDWYEDVYPLSNMLNVNSCKQLKKTQLEKHCCLSQSWLCIFQHLSGQTEQVYLPNVISVFSYYIQLVFNPWINIMANETLNNSFEECIIAESVKSAIND